MTTQDKYFRVQFEIASLINPVYIVVGEKKLTLNKALKLFLGIPCPYTFIIDKARKLSILIPKLLFKDKR